MTRIRAPMAMARYNEAKDGTTAILTITTTTVKPPATTTTMTTMMIGNDDDVKHGSHNHNKDEKQR